MRKTMSAAMALLVVWGCDNSSETTSPRTGETVRASFALVSGQALRSSSAASLFADEAALFGNVPGDAITEIAINVTRVEVQPAEGEGSWQSFDVDGGGQLIDLLSLPTEVADALILVQDAELTAGDYKARLYFDDGDLTLGQNVCLGNSNGGANGGPPCLEASESPFDIIVPSSQNTGIKTFASFSIDDTGTDPLILLVFDENATLANVTYAPGQEAFMVAPVIHGPRNNNGGGGS